MEAFPRFLAMLTQGWFPGVAFQVQKWIKTNWGVGSMIGLSASASILINSSEMPTVVSVGILTAYAAGAVGYTLQNWGEIRQFAPSTALTLSAITLIVLHLPSSWLLVISSAPIFITLTLLASVNIAPTVTTTMRDLGAGFSEVRALVTRSRTRAGQDMDVEQAMGLLHEMMELPNTSDEESDDLVFETGHMHHITETRAPGLAEDDPDDIELASVSVSTTPYIREQVQIIIPPRTQASQDVTVSTVSPIQRANIVFPPTPEDDPLDMPLNRIVSSSRTENSSLIHMIPE